MTTARMSIFRALRLLRVTTPGIDPTAEEANDALTSLNAMMAAYKVNGLNQYTHVTLALDDGFHALLAPHQNTIDHMLAIACSPEYGRTPNPVILGVAQSGWSTMLADSTLRKNDSVKLPRGLRFMPSSGHCGASDVIND